MSISTRSLRLVVTAIVLVCANPVFSGPPRSEKGEEIAQAKGAVNYVEDRVICHTFDTCLDLPPNNDVVDLPSIEGDSRFARFLIDHGFVTVKRVFNWNSVAGVNALFEGRENEFTSLDRSYTLFLPRDLDVHAAIDLLADNPDVMTVEPDYLLNFSQPADINGIPAQFEKDDDLWDGQWELHDPDEEYDYGIGCPIAWSNIGYGDSDVRVGIIERGIDAYHQDFYLASTSYVVDGLYWVIGFGEQGYWSDNINYWSNDDVHGNAVAGIIGARSWNGVGVNGVAGGDGTNEEGVSLLSLRMDGVVVTTSQFADLIIKGSDPENTAGKDCDVINISSTSTVYSETVRLAVIHAYERGCTIVSNKTESYSSGILDYDFNFPGDYDYSMTTCVSGYADDGSLCNGDCGNYYMNYGRGLDLLAPAAPYPALTDDDDWGTFGANSGATPHVSGAIALIRSSSQCSGANLRPEDYEWLLKLTACKKSTTPGDCGDSRYWDQDNGHGALRLGSYNLDAGVAEHLAATGHVFRAYDASGGTVCDSMFTSSPQEYTFSSSQFRGAYLAKVYRVRVNVEYPDSFLDTPLAWGICDAGIGISAANPNYCKSYSIVEDGSQSATGCNIITYVMKLYNVQTQAFVRWFPCSPEQVSVRCRVSGVLDDKKLSVMRPAQSSIATDGSAILQLSATTNGSVTLRVYDIRGRMVHRAAGIDVRRGENAILWDGRGDSGRQVPAGVYFMKVDGAVNTEPTRVFVLR